MLGAYPSHGPDDALTRATWVDLVDATAAERAAFEKAFGLSVPTERQLVEIEATSRLRVEQGALYMTAPLICVPEAGPWALSPTGFVLCRQVLLTVRPNKKSAAFDSVIAECGRAEKLDPANVFVRLLEALVDGMADLLETSGGDLDDASHLIFRQEALQRRRLAHEAAQIG
jgi:magnesium transporter